MQIRNLPPLLLTVMAVGGQLVVALVPLLMMLMMHVGGALGVASAVKSRGDRSHCSGGQCLVGRDSWANGTYIIDLDSPL